MRAQDAPILMRGEHIAITATDVEADAQMRIPPEVRGKALASVQTVGQIASNLYIRRAWGEQAVAAGLDKDPKVASALRVARDKVLSDAWLERMERQGALSDADALRAAQAIYRAKPERFKVAEQVRARHILIAGDSPESRVRAQKLADDIKGGADFVKLAREHSADKSNAERGGDLGFFEKGRMVAAFGDAAFALKNKGDVSGVVQTEFGYHVIQLEERKPEFTRSFEEVKNDLLKEVRTNVTQEARVASAQEIQKGAQPNTEAIGALAARFAEPAAAK